VLQHSHLNDKELTMPAIPPFVLKKLYSKGSLRTEMDGFAFDLKNTIAPATITALTGLDVDDERLASAQVTVIPPDSQPRATSDISVETPLALPLNATITLRVAGETLRPGLHSLTIHIVVQEVGPLEIPITETLA
jgi:hydroxymethylglutaryl-CoA reductase (NADPH)